ncbi:MAG: histidine kinase [Roseovarius sp. BRH_c41]|uniref:phage tail length tape measure family protein n=1 Tax=Roseovarius sp. BRH_c41 TaxID=1629709 RepID=UPI0005F13E24|nr:phage tail length tape measure family protein [Roseovarius sp. BRH_c41]KJS43353.1 MAG: histidine kinase [Roseovarius sp. BRH_c41]
MTLVARAEILMDADQAKAELQATGTAAKGAAQDIRGVGTQGANAARGVKQLETAARTSATGLTAASSAANVNTAATQKMASANRLAAGSMGNLVAQGNDVFVMLAAGQNPLTLAIQQGTQITQVIGPLGAAGAFRALGGAVLAMLSPINLITIGALAATATVVNWFMSSSEEAESFADSVEALETRIDSLKDKIAEASATRLELADRFGEGFVDRAQDILDRIVEAEKRAAQREAASNIGSFVGETGINPSRGVGFNRRAIEDEFDFGGIIRDRSVFDEQRRLAEAVAEDLIALQDAAGGTIEQQQGAIEALILSYTAAAEAVGTISEAEEARLLTLDQMRIRLAEVAELQSQNPEDNRQSEEMLTFLDLVTKSTGEQLKAEAAAQAMLLTLTEQNAVAEAIARTGADSVEVSRLRAQFALNAKLEEIAASDASEATKEALREAAEAAFDLSTVDVSGALNAAANEAARLSAEVRGAVDAMFDLQSQGQAQLETARIRAEFRDDPVGRAGALAGARFDRDTQPLRRDGFANAGEEAFLNSQRQAAIEQAREIARLNEQARPTRSGSGARGTSTNETLREQQALDRLIASKQREIEALRESDPVQREMIRLRERLTAATPKQRAEIEALVEAHENERVAMERKEEFGNAVDDVLLEAESLRDVWEGIGDMIIRAAKEALILGSGPLSGLFGGSGGGGLLSGIFGGGGLGDLFDLFSGGSLLSFANGGLPGFASGGDPLVTRPGLLLGAGTGRGDRIRAMVSAGEFIMTAEATARNRAVLEAMNAGAIIPGFAGGGLPLPVQAAGAAPARGGGAGASAEGMTRLRIEPSDLFRVVVEDRARDVAVDVVDNFSNEQLPLRVETIRRDPLGRG